MEREGSNPYNEAASDHDSDGNPMDPQDAINMSNLSKSGAEKKKFGHRLVNLNKKVKERVQLKKTEIQEKINKKKEEKLSKKMQVIKIERKEQAE